MLTIANSWLRATSKNFLLPEFVINRFACFFQVVVPKAKGEILGVVIVESGWGSMLPTIVLANLLPGGPAARCGQLNIGDQVIAQIFENVSLVKSR